MCFQLYLIPIWTGQYLRFNILSVKQFLVRQKYHLSCSKTKQNKTKLWKPFIVPTPTNTLWDPICWWFFFYHCLWPSWRRKERPARGSPLLIWIVLGDWTYGFTYARQAFCHWAIAPARGNPLEDKVSRLFMPWQSALQQITKISWGLPDFSLVSHPGFCCFHKAACLSCFKIFHSMKWRLFFMLWEHLC